MRNNFIWIFLLICPLVLVTSRPAESHRSPAASFYNEGYRSASAPAPGPASDQVISVRITSSVAVGRSHTKPSNYDRYNKRRYSPPRTELPDDLSSNETDSAEDFLLNQTENDPRYSDAVPSTYPTETPLVEPRTETFATTQYTELPNLLGANIEFIKQLNARKSSREYNKPENDRYYNAESFYPNDTEDSAAEASVKSVSEVIDDGGHVVNNDNVPRARSIPFSVSSDNQVHGYARRRPFNDRHSDPKLTTAGFNILHDTSLRPHLSYDHYNKPAESTSSAPLFAKPHTNTNLPKIYNEPAKVYGEPSKVYSEPAKFYSEPAKVYSEPAKIYSEPAKVYSEPAKIYSEPAKFYSEPASLHLPPGVSNLPWQNPSPRPNYSSGGTYPPSITTTTPISSHIQHTPEQQPERNYEVDENVSVLTDGRSHGVQDGREKCKQENCKVGYVVEGRQYKKYQVEEKTPDGFIVGEYGVVRNEDGALRGVRYTADSDVSPRLIYDTLMKFLQLK